MCSSRAQSSVIGTVLIVAVVVVLSAAIGVYTTSLASPSSVPQAGFAVTQEGVAGDDELSVTIRFAHEAGDSLATDNLEVRIDGTAATELSSVSASMPAKTAAGGDTLTLTQDSKYGLTGGESVSVVYVTEDESATLATHEVNGQDPGATLEILSFESGSPGDTSPPDPWNEVFNPQEGSMNILGSPVSDGSRALKIQGTGNGVNDKMRTGQNVGVTVNVSDVAEIRYDVYVNSTNKNAGELRMTVFKNGNEKKFDGLAGSNTNQWLSRTIDVSGLSGEVKVIAHADGSDNEAVFDNIRFYDANGDQIPASEILSG